MKPAWLRDKIQNICGETCGPDGHRHLREDWMEPETMNQEELNKFRYAIRYVSIFASTRKDVGNTLDYSTPIHY